MPDWSLCRENRERVSTNALVSAILATGGFGPPCTGASLSAARYNPVIKPFYDRLRAAGKPGKVARCAAARKLLHLAYAVATNQEDFDANYQPKGKRSRTGS